MKSDRRAILKSILVSPLAALLGYKGKSPPEASQPSDLIQASICCAICEHYVPPRDTFLTMLDGPASGYCKCPLVRDGFYVNPYKIDRKLFRRPWDRCRDYLRRGDSFGVIIKSTNALGTQNLSDTFSTSGKPLMDFA